MRTKHTIRWMTMAVLTGLLCTGCTPREEPTPQVVSAVASVDQVAVQMIYAEPEPIPEPEPEPVFQEYDIELMAIGDNLMHMGIVYTGKQKDGSYNYDCLFDELTPFLEEAEVKVINQETILAGNDLGFSGYPKFNSPTEVGDAIGAAGFNVVLHASNHSGDKGIEGLQNCVTFWESHPEVLMTGIHKEAASSHEIPILTIGDIDFAILNYTYSANSSTLKKELRGHLNMLCNWNEENGQIDFKVLHPQVLADIAAAEELADVTIVFPHWGNEYRTKPSQYQQEFARQMTEAGADLIIGTHPHVIQPVEWVESDNGNRALCYYSLGNYVSTQKQTQCMLEAMAWVTFTVKEDGIVLAEEKSGVLPMVCHYKSGPVRLQQVYLLEEYTEELAAAHGIKQYGQVELKLDELQQWSQEILGDWVITAAEALEE
ncbi:MAG: CapA family protein [Lachnospiraceae bacterium]|nr:CapA family protein [Lachnospiraceae bacterium]